MCWAVIFSTFALRVLRFTKGPIFTEFLLADEINRTPPKPQSALLEAMQEKSVTIDGKSYQLAPVFTVAATQNPVEHEGTYPLPEAQLDRFLFKLIVGYPNEAEEMQAVKMHGQQAGSIAISELGLAQLSRPADIVAMRKSVAQVRLEDSLVEYIVKLVRATREHGGLAVGMSPRAATMIAAAARAHAACDGRDYALPDDVKALFMPIARHRVMLAPAAEMDDLEVESILAEIIASLPAPK